MPETARGASTEVDIALRVNGGAQRLRLDSRVTLFVEWDIEHGLMIVHRWSPRDGYTSTTRGYP